MTFKKLVNGVPFGAPFFVFHYHARPVNGRAGVRPRAPRMDKVNNGQSAGQISVRFDTAKSHRLLTGDFFRNKFLHHDGIQILWRGPSYLTRHSEEITIFDYDPRGNLCIWYKDEP